MDMLVSLKKEMEEREKRWEQQQKITEEFLEADFRRREQRWEQILRQRGEEWKKEIERRERELMQKLDTKIKTFYNEQLKRDEDVLSFLEKERGKYGSRYVAEGRGVQISLKGTIQGIWKAHGEERQRARDG